MAAPHASPVSPARTLRLPVVAAATAFFLSCLDVLIVCIALSVRLDAAR